MSEGQTGMAPDSDVYTVFLIVATIVVGSATVFLCVRSQELFGAWNPFVGA